MHHDSIHIQRELTWLMDAIYKLSPEEFRPNAASATVHPKIYVLKIDGGYAATFVWNGVDTELTIPTDKALDMLRQKSRPLIDAALQATHQGKPYIRRPLLIELQMTLQPQAVLISPLHTGKLRCEPLLHFPWRSEHEFSCANDRDVEDARRVNRMIVEGNAVAYPF
jgi:hypothetical protein|tara:strand:- start:60 stop:560 length:501 start_codon:yes stop_codon:yes gene_type:complete